MRRFEGKAVVITGGTRGIGGAASRQLGREGARTVITGRTQEDGEKIVAEITAAGGTAVFQRGDVAIEEDSNAAIERCVSEFGTIDVLLNNAAPIDLLALNDKPVAEQTAAEFETVMRGTLFGAVQSVRAALPHMLAQGHGSIVNTSSIASIQGLAGIPAYSAAKGGLNAFTRQVARDYGTRGIRSNAVIIGQFPTEGSRPVLDHPEVAKVHADFLLIPRGRYGTCEEAAECILWVASDAASYLQGTSVTIDAGATVQSTIPDISAIFAESRAAGHTP
jgi:NAD(P)-dependent dehydrogenase (short-subunit alcohol dehydrogenase family)